MSKLFDLENKIVLITGGGTHLGKAMSEAVAEFGGTLILASRDENRTTEHANKLKSLYNIEAIGMKLDFTDDTSIKHLLSAIIEKYGKIDVLINNSFFAKAGKIEEQSYEDFMEGIHGTIGGTFNMTKHTLGIMLKQKHGNIINISSMYGVVSPNPNLYEGTNNMPNPANYGAGKAAVIQFTKYIACNYAKHNIRCNCIVPGTFPNPGVQEDTDFIKNLCDKNPMGRIGVPNDLKGITVLLSSDASSYMTGQAIHVDGGWTAW